MNRGSIRTSLLIRNEIDKRPPHHLKLIFTNDPASLPRVFQSNVKTRLTHQEATQPSASGTATTGSTTPASPRSASSFPATATSSTIGRVSNATAARSAVTERSAPAHEPGCTTSGHNDASRLRAGGPSRNVPASTCAARLANNPIKHMIISKTTKPTSPAIPYTGASAARIRRISCMRRAKRSARSGLVSVPINRNIHCNTNQRKRNLSRPHASRLTAEDTRQASRRRE